MANSIELFKKNAPELLDKVYREVSTTADFDTDGALVQAGQNANEIIIPVLDMDGLGDFDRNSGYVDGDVTLTSETKKFNYERGRRLKTDVIDDEETGGTILANLASEFERTKVVPELDAVRYATYASVEGASVVEGTYTTGEDVYTAIATAWDEMTNAEVPEEDRYLRITPALFGMIRDMDTYKSRGLMERFADIKVVPQNRFQTEITLESGKDSESEGGYKAGDDSKNINFMIIHKPAILQYTKHNQMKLFTPDQDQDGDNYKWLYRIYGLNEAYANKVAGIYASVEGEEAQEEQP